MALASDKKVCLVNHGYEPNQWENVVETQHSSPRTCSSRRVKIMAEHFSSSSLSSASSDWDNASFFGEESIYIDCSDPWRNKGEIAVLGIQDLFLLYDGFYHKTLYSIDFLPS